MSPPTSGPAARRASNTGRHRGGLPRPRGGRGRDGVAERRDPRPGRSTHASQTQLEWIIDAYLLVFCGLLLPAGALGDRYGRRRALIAGLVIFGGPPRRRRWPSPPRASLILLRGLTGAGAALVMPATLSTITSTFPAAERTRAVGVWAAVAGGSAVLGLLCSGACWRRSHGGQRSRST